MDQQPKNKLNVTHNILWKKWQLKKKQYQKQRSIKASSIQFSNNLSNLMITSSQRFSQSQPYQSIKEQGSSMQVQRKSYQQFLNSSGFKNQFDVNWLMVGQPRAFYISNKKKINNSNTNNPQMKSAQSLKNDKKLIRSSPNWRRLRSQGLPQGKNLNFSKYNAHHSNKQRFLSQPQIQRITIKSQPSLIVKRQRRNSKFECRPWSRSEKQSVVDFVAHQTH